MDEFFTLLKNFDFKGLFITPTTNGFLQFVRYVFVGAIATIADWGVLFLLTEFAHIYYLVSAVIAFFAGLITNYVLSKILVFKANEARVGAAFEFAGYAVIGAVGLAFTELIIYLLTDKLGLYYMVSKIAATVIVLAWNYIARKLILYKN